MQLSPSLPARLAAAAVLLAGACSEPNGAGPPEAGDRRPVPVEVGAVERGPITDRRTVSGSIEAREEFAVTSKVAGRLASVEVDLGDPVRRGQVVARIDDEELSLAVREAEADLAVARASHAEAESALEIAARALTRLESLREDGVASEAELDAARADELAARVQVDVTQARAARAEASLEGARLRLGHATVTAEWGGEGDTRTVAARYVDAGSNVTAATRLLSIVQLDPVVAVAYVAERDYGKLSVGQSATLTTDAHPGREFAGRVARIAPVFDADTRQARVELELPNPDGALKPGMFVRATLELAHVADATTLPYEALTERDGEAGVMVLAEDGGSVRWRTVTPLIREGERLQVRERDLRGFVVILGQELCDDGSPVLVVDGSEGPPER